MRTYATVIAYNNKMGRSRFTRHSVRLSPRCGVYAKCIPARRACSFHAQVACTHNDNSEFNPVPWWGQKRETLTNWASQAAEQHHPAQLESLNQWWDNFLTRRKNLTQSRRSSSVCVVFLSDPPHWSRKEWWIYGQRVHFIGKLANEQTPFDPFKKWSTTRCLTLIHFNSFMTCYK